MPSEINNSPVWQRLVRFEDDEGQTYCGEPVDADVDVGLAMLGGQAVQLRVLDTQSALDFGARFTGEIKSATTILTPLTEQEVGTIRCVGLNYTDHAAEMKAPVPKKPEIFLKPSTCLHSPTAPIHIPAVAANQTDPEVELAIIIGRDCKNATVENAMEFVLGYTVANDLTARVVQAGGSQWGYSKGFDGFAPMGPCIVSRARLPDPSVLKLRSTLDGKVMQDGRADNMIFTVAEIITHVSVGTTLRKGTVILTGTPSGIGASHNPPLYLKGGCESRMWISHGLGTLTNPVVQD